uniref:DNA-binding protein n=1 Tax=Muribaculaceae bacterium Z82 TaxID=2304548 RepID=A0A7C9NYQ4_9BACT
MMSETVFLGTLRPAPAEPELFAAAPEVMGAKEVADLLGLSVATVRREIAERRLPAFRIRSRVMVRKAALTEYLLSLEG